MLHIRIYYSIKNGEKFYNLDKRQKPVQNQIKYDQLNNIIQIQLFDVL